MEVLVNNMSALAYTLYVNYLVLAYLLFTQTAGLRKSGCLFFVIEGVYCDNPLFDYKRAAIN